MGLRRRAGSGLADARKGEVGPPQVAETGSLPSLLHPHRNEVNAMIVLGIILLVVGFLLKFSLLWTIGLILLVVGLVLMVMGRTGHAVGRRRHYF
jgi:uncharacterized membrane protein HdeD (DUF308 family)